MTRPASHRVIEPPEQRCATCKWLSTGIDLKSNCHFPVNRYSIPQRIKRPDHETCDEWQEKAKEQSP